MALKEPRLRVKPNESFVLQVENSMSNKIRSEDDLPTPEVLGDLHRLKKYNPCAGPIYVEGAKPGDTLAVDIIDIVVEDKGYVLIEPGAGPLADLQKYPDGRGPFTKFIRHLPGPSGTTSDGIGVFSNDIQWKLQPLVGTLGVVPDRPASGSDTVTMQCAYGGNLDTREFRKGHRIYIPVAHEGALLYAGDVHASQATEFGGTGDESRAEITLRCDIIPNKTTPFVRVETPTEIIQLNSYRPIEEGFRQAHMWLLDWLVEDFGFTVKDAVFNLAVNPDIRANVYALSMWGKMNYTIGVSFPKSNLGKAVAG
ncbi:acetamidase/formamidase family protein [Mesorhizobium sp. AaZ16]|uniref:acetamidase/formamidase family protein n=1 Tax=Mesorhizobium sp. AaZ16 TaxID=3402289 RepID=UPI00374E69C8